MVGKRVKIPFYLIFIFLFFSCTKENQSQDLNDPFFLEKINKFSNRIDAPNFTSVSTSGKHVELSELRGKSVLINFWASWCGPCVEELPSLINLSSAVNDDPDIVILLINVGESRDIITKFEGNSGYNLETYLDQDKSISSLYGVRGIPTTLFVDSNGQIAGSKVGAHAWDSSGVIDILKSLK